MARGRTVGTDRRAGLCHDARADGSASVHIDHVDTTPRPFFDNKPCRLLASPLDVRLPKLEEADEAVETVVQPDVLVVCDPAKVDEKGVRGAPDLVIEILSESTMHHDMVGKLRLYEIHGVRCYIIADPWNKTLTVRYQEAPGQFGRPELFAGDDKMPVRIFEGLEIELARVFGRV